MAEIPDFDLRQKTAQLIAVAPGLPVSDLYHLLMEKNGRFEAALKEAVRASQAPSNMLNSTRKTAPPRSVTVPTTTSPRMQGYCEGEAEIKIDFDDPMFTWDNDAPITPQPEPQCRRQQTKKKQTKETMKRTANAFTESAIYAEAEQATGKARKRPASHVVKSSTLTGNINRGIRATSYDLEFIVPDDEISENSDDTFYDTDESVLRDIDMTDDGTDLMIDMEPEFAYNSDILSSPCSS